MVELGAVTCTARAPACDGCPVIEVCTWHAAGAPDPDPGRSTARQARFDGSDRQGRGRLVAALRAGPVAAARLADVAGWPGDPARARRVAEGLVTDGLAEPDGAGGLRLAGDAPTLSAP
jgi:A/G-specific adenine glycosylase